MTDILVFFVCWLAVCVVFLIGMIIYVCHVYEHKLKKAEIKRINDMIDINRGPHVCYKDKLLKERDIEIKALDSQIKKTKQWEQEKEQAIEIAHVIDLTFKDMEIKRLNDEIKKLKKRKKSK